VCSEAADYGTGACSAWHLRIAWLVLVCDCARPPHCLGFGCPSRNGRTDTRLCTNGHPAESCPLVCKCRFNPALHRAPLARNCRVFGRTRLRSPLEIDQVFKILTPIILDIAYEVTYTLPYWRN